MKEILRAEKLSKKYFKDPNLGTIHGTKDILRAAFKRPPVYDLREHERWVVRNVDISLKKGETLGLIGTNGSGKSTTLKMLAGLILPTKGKVEAHGSIQSLINLGAGLNDKLNGIDNIKASATLFGFKKNEIEAVVKNVREFSELGDYIFNPINTYSSGMYARLGFSIAVNLRPEIMLIDEVLAVGDYNFQNKCRVHLEQLKREGTSIVLVSHSNTHIAQICENALWLHNGKVRDYGSSKNTLENYLEFLEDRLPKNKKNSKSNIYGPQYELNEKIKNFKIIINSKVIHSNDNYLKLNINESLNLNFSFESESKLSNLNITFCLYREDGLLIFALSSIKSNDIKNVGGKISGKLFIDNINLSPGNYKLVMPIHEGSSYLFRDTIVELEVKGISAFNKGILMPRYEFEIKN